MPGPILNDLPWFERLCSGPAYGIQIYPRFKSAPGSKSQTWGRLEAWWLRYLEAPGSNTEQVTCGQLIIL
jgi:hypothetical protein